MEQYTRGRGNVQRRTVAGKWGNTIISFNFSRTRPSRQFYPKPPVTLLHFHWIGITIVMSVYVVLFKQPVQWRVNCTAFIIRCHRSCMRIFRIATCPRSIRSQIVFRFGFISCRMHRWIGFNIEEYIATLAADTTAAVLPDRLIGPVYAPNPLRAYGLYVGVVLVDVGLLIRSLNLVPFRNLTCSNSRSSSLK